MSRDIDIYEVERAMRRRSESLALTILNGVFGVMLWAVGTGILRVQEKVKGK